MLINPRLYAEIFFDQDGVLVDTNILKKQNIEKATLFKGQEFAAKFANYFASNNGLTREKKVSEWFSKDDAIRVLGLYNELNKHTLADAPLLPGTVELLETLTQMDVILHVFTGGTETESIQLLENKKLFDYFKQVHGGPKSKIENFELSAHTHPILYFGDSKSDHTFSVAKNLDFIFVSGVTQFTGWQDYFADRPIKGIVKNLRGVQILDLPH